MQIVCLSGGKDSTAMALRLQEVEPQVPRRYFYTPTGNELPAMAAHWARLAGMLDGPLETLGHHTLEGLMAAQECLPSTRMRWCTRMLKVEPVVRAYRVLPPGTVACVGLRADEPERGGVFGTAVEQRFPLREWGWGIADVRAYLKGRNITIPERTDCAWCPYQAADDWYRLWRDDRSVFDAAVAWEARLGHTFRSPTAKHGSWAVSLADMAAQFESGKITREEKARRERLPLLPGVDDDVESCRVCRL